MSLVRFGFIALRWFALGYDFVAKAQHYNTRFISPKVIDIGSTPADGARNRTSSPENRLGFQVGGTRAAKQESRSWRRLVIVCRRAFDGGFMADPSGEGC